MTGAVLQKTPHRRRNISFAVAVFCCVAFFSGAASAAISWKRVGTVTTLTNNQLCYTDGTNVVCDSSAPTLLGGNVGIGTTTPGDTLTINGDVGYMLGADYTTTGSQSDVNLGAVSAVRYNGTATATFQGIVAGTSGQILYLHNPSAYTLTLADQSDSTDATAANKIITGIGGDLGIPTNTSVTLQYDAASARWRVTGSSNAAKSLPAGSTGQVQFNNAGAFGATANFFWDNTNSRLAIGTSAAPLSNLDIYGGIAVGTSYAGVTAAPTNGMIVQGNVGIGTAGPNANSQLDVYTTSSAPSGNAYGVIVQGPQTVADTGTYYGIYDNPTYTAVTGNTLAALNGLTTNPGNTSTGAVTNLRGVYTLPANSGGGTVGSLFGDESQPANSSGTVTSLYGMYSNPQTSGTAVTTTTYGVYSVPQLTGSGALTSVFGVYVDPFATAAASGTITNQYGVYIRGGNNSTAGAVITNYYQAYLATPLVAGTITKSYGVYQQDTNSTNYFAGNVGIGTTGPLSTLNVAGTTGITWAAAGNSSGLVTFGTGGTSGGSLWVNTASLNGSYQSGLGVTGSYGTPSLRSVVNINAYGANSAGGYGSDLAFSTTKNGTLTEAMRIDTNGNVGIGTTSPNSKLDVLGYGIDVGGDWVTGTARTDATNKGGYLTTPHYTNAQSPVGMIMGLNSSATNAVYIGGGTSNVNAATAIVFYTGATTTTATGTEYMRITSTGSVGIGTTSPATGMKADINGPVKIAGTGSEACTASTVGAMRYNAAGNYMEICSYP